MSEGGAKKYAAYICYSHRDEKNAAWLHQHLERYRIPRGVALGYGVREWFGRRIGKVFRDREELPAGQPLTPKLYEALADSDALIVLCSPNAVSSRYVNDEIAEFRRLGRADRIFPVILSDDPPTCYPLALKDSGENLNADMRRGRDGRDGALIKVLAGLMGLGPDDLIRRERRAQRWRVAAATATASVFGLIAVLALLLGVQAQQNATRAHDTLIRMLGERGQKALDDGKSFLAMRYALAAQRLSQANAADYTDLLTTAYDRIGTNTRSLGAGEGVNVLAISPGGRRIVSASEKRLRLWDAASGLPIGEPLVGHRGKVNVVVFSPDGRWIASGDEEGTLRLWDGATGRPIGGPLIGHSGSVEAMTFSPDSNRIVSGGNDGTLRLWDRGSGRQIGDPFAGHQGAVLSVTFSPDGRRLASGGYDNTLRLWDIGARSPVWTERSLLPVGPNPTFVGVRNNSMVRITDAAGREIGDPMAGHEAMILAVAFSPDGRRIASGGADKLVRLWDATSGRMFGAAPGHNGPVRAVGFTPDGHRIVSIGWDQMIKLWDAVTGRQIGERAFVGRENNAHAFVAMAKGDREEAFVVDARELSNTVALSSDGGQAAYGGDDGIIRLMDTDASREIGQPMVGHRLPIKSVSFAPDGRRIVSGSFDQTLRLWDGKDGSPVGEAVAGHPGQVVVAFSPGGGSIFSSGADRIFRARDTATNQVIREITLILHEDSASRSQSAAAESETVTVGERGSIVAVAFSPDQSRIVSSEGDRTLRLWDAATGHQIGQPFRGHLTGPALALAVSPDGRTIASGGVDNTVRLWDASKGREIGEPLRGHKATVMAIAFSPDGRRVVSGALDTMRLWDATTRREIGEPLRGHKGGVAKVAFSSDGRRIVSAGMDGMIRFWDAGTGRTLGDPIPASEGGVLAVDFSRDAQRLVSGGADAKLRLWDVKLFTQSDSLTVHDACVHALGTPGRRFQPAEIQDDILLLSEWPDADRDVCEGVLGVSPLPRATPTHERTWFQWLIGWFGWR